MGGEGVGRKVKRRYFVLALVWVAWAMIWQQHGWYSARKERFARLIVYYADGGRTNVTTLMECERHPCIVRLYQDRATGHVWPVIDGEK